jgi:predicted dehydrogenase
METPHIAIVGCGFWAGFQVAAWQSLPAARVVAVCDQHAERALVFQRRFNIPQAFSDLDELLEKTQPDLVDIITVPETHAVLVQKVANRGIPVVSQKPLTPSWDSSKALLAFCQEKNTPLFVHENWRWQAPIRRVKQLLNADAIGRVFRARLSCSHAFPVFNNQPNLKELPELIIADLGVHLLDAVRFLLGEVQHLYCQITRITPGIQGEDVATLLLTMQNGCQCSVELSFVTQEEKPSFPQTMIHLEGEKGSIVLREAYELTLINAQGVQREQAPPKLYPWVDPDYAVVQSSILDCNRQFLEHIQGIKVAENTGADNLETLRLVYMAYASARENRVIFTQDFI